MERQSSSSVVPSTPSPPWLLGLQVVVGDSVGLLGRVEDKGVSGVHEVKERVIEPGVLI